MTATTSIDVYRDLLATGLLPAMRKQVLAWLIDNAARLPMTAREIDTEGCPVDAPHKRLRELQRQGLVDTGPVRECRITGRKALTWRLADDPPHEPMPLPAATGVIRAWDQATEIRRILNRIEAAIADALPMWHVETLKRIIAEEREEL